LIDRYCRFGSIFKGQHSKKNAGNAVILGCIRNGVGSDWFSENIMLASRISFGVKEVRGWKEVGLFVGVGWWCSEVKWTRNMKRLPGAERCKVKGKKNKKKRKTKNKKKRKKQEKRKQMKREKKNKKKENQGKGKRKTRKKENKEKGKEKQEKRKTRRKGKIRKEK